MSIGSLPAGALLFMGVTFILFPALDIFMLVSLLVPGDERGQIIVWKAGSFTLLAFTGSLVLDILINIARGQPMTANPFIQLSTAAILYFAALLYYRKKHSV